MINLTDYTERKNENELEIAGGYFAVIYMTADKKDYCREMPPRSMYIYSDCAKWARDHFSRTADITAYKAVSGFRIEVWY